MEEDHKQVLTSLRSFLVKNIIFESIEDALIEQDIFTEDMIERIKAQTTSTDKNRHLIGDLQRRGPFAYGKFVTALRQSGHEHVADKMLQQQLGDSSGSSQRTSYPASTSRHPTHQGQQVSGAVPMSSDDTDNPQQNRISPLRMGVPEADEIYKMDKHCKGEMCIISNYIFTNPENNRKGWHIDSDKLHRTFGKEGLGFNIHKEGHNLTAEAMVQRVKDFVEDPRIQSGQCSSTVLVILSHGNDQGFLGVEDKKVEEDAILRLFNVRGLLDKPKLFIFQACRGGRENTRVSSEVQDATKVSESSERQSIPSKHVYQDMLIAYATPKGFAAFRHTHEGSRFINAVCEVFEKESRKEHVVDMLVKVNRKVAEYGGDSIQLPGPTMHLTKKWFLFPELL